MNRSALIAYVKWDDGVAYASVLFESEAVGPGTRVARVQAKQLLRGVVLLVELRLLVAARLSSLYEIILLREYFQEDGCDTHFRNPLAYHTQRARATREPKLAPFLRAIV